METKKWYMSKTIIASLVAVAISLLTGFGIIDLSGQEDSIAETVLQLVTAAAAALAVYGRITAKEKISND